MIYITDIPQQNVNIFDCISTNNQIFIPEKKSVIIDYLVSVYPRNDNLNDFSFVYGLFETKDVAFSRNQDVILNLATLMFSGSVPLDDFEQKVLNKTFERTLKTRYTLPRRQ